MLDEKKSTLHFGTRSLLPLTLALIEAEKESPARAPRRPTDVDEELARQLVQKMRKEFRKFHVVALNVRAERSERQPSAVEAFS